MDPKFLEGLRQKYIQDPPEGMTASLVKGMTDSDLIEDDGLDDVKKAFISSDLSS